jgi:hypothetical protein
MILDLATTDVLHLFALSAAVLALGGVYWLVRDQDRRAPKRRLTFPWIVIPL